MRTHSRSAFSFLTGVLAASCLAVTGVGVAAAANGGSLTLGHTNKATSTTTLTDGKGTPLSLVGRTSKPPLRVNSSKQVAHLNASLLGGKSATGLETYGSGAHFFGNDGEDPPSLSDTATPTEIAQTAALAPGAYYVSAFVYLDLNPTTVAYCFINPVGSYDYFDSPAMAENQASGSRVTVAPSTVVTLTKSTVIAFYCSGSDGGAAVRNGGIAAIRLAHFAPGSTSLSQSG